MSGEFDSGNKETEHFVDIQSFTEGKNPPKNEDYFGFNDNTIVLSDGATDKTGLNFEGSTGGEIASKVVVETCLASQNTGETLVEEISERLRGVYAQINPEALTDSSYRFAATLVAAKVVNDTLIVTQVGDSSFRINGQDEYKNDKVVDSLTAGTRKAYIEATGDINGSRDYILPLLKTQHQYQNNPDSPLGYGIIDGTSVPSKFIRTFEFPKDAVKTLEVVSDGYYGVFPVELTPESYEAAHRSIEEADPFKYSQFASTKLSDDRTVIIANLA